MLVCPVSGCGKEAIKSIQDIVFKSQSNGLNKYYRNWMA